MVRIEKIVNGYIISFINIEKEKIKMYFANFEDMSTWLKTQFEKKEN